MQTKTADKRSAAGASRKRRGTKPWMWTPEDDKLLGTDSDEVIARKLGRSWSTVRRRRAFLKIPCSKKRRIPKLWTPQEDKLLGTETDKAIGRKLRCSGSTVSRRRALLGIPVSPMVRKVLAEGARRMRENWEKKHGHGVLNPRHKPWRPVDERLLGKVADDELAKQLGRTMLAVQKRRRALGLPGVGRMEAPWSTKEIQLLGKLPDRLVARRIGRNHSAVRAKRMRLKIRGYVKKETWSCADVALLGTMSDAELARLLKRSEGAVFQKRRALKIPAVDNRRYWRPEDDAILGTRPDDQIALLLGRSVSAVASRRRIKHRRANWQPQRILANRVEAYASGDWRRFGGIPGSSA